MPVTLSFRKFRPGALTCVGLLALARLRAAEAATPATVAGTPLKDDSNVVVLTERTVVDLALRRSLALRFGELDRQGQRFALQVAKRQFVPQVTLIGGALQTDTRDRSGTPTVGNDAVTASVSPQVSQQLPTGGALTVGWDNAYSQLTPVPDSPVVPGEARRSWTPQWVVSFSQPLLKGGGLTAGTAALRTAETQEEMNILSYRGLIIDTVTTALLAFRSYLQAQQQLEIAQLAFQRSGETLEIDRALVDSGRIAAVELVQARADRATRELSAVTARNALDSSRLALVRLFNLDRSTRFTTPEPPVVAAVQIDAAAQREHALQQRTDLLQAKLQLRLAELGLSLAHNNRLWSVNLVAGYSGTANGYPYGSAYDDLRDRKNTAWSAGVQVDVPIWGDLTRAQTILNANISLTKTQLSLRDLQEAIEVQVIDAVRNADVAFQQVGLARSARELTEESLKYEHEKLAAGHSTTFEIVRIEDDLVNAQSEEMNATIGYLNALTQLDQTTSSTLETWRIEFKP